MIIIMRKSIYFYFVLKKYNDSVNKISTEVEENIYNENGEENNQEEYDTNNYYDQ